MKAQAAWLDDLVLTANDLRCGRASPRDAVSIVWPDEFFSNGAWTCLDACLAMHGVA